MGTITLPVALGPPVPPVIVLASMVILRTAEATKSAPVKILLFSFSPLLRGFLDF